MLSTISTGMAEVTAANERECPLMIVDFGALGVEVAAQANSMIRERAVSRVELGAVAPIAAEHVRRGAIVDEVAGEIGLKRHRRVAAERRDLIIEVRPDHTLKREHSEVVLFELTVRDIGRRIDRHALSGIPAADRDSPESGNGSPRCR